MTIKIELAINSFVLLKSEFEWLSKTPKYIFVTGGVSSSLGKGIISASFSQAFTIKGLNVTIQKFDPYINIDPGTLNPYEHGECYVTSDGTESFRFEIWVTMRDFLA